MKSALEQITPLTQNKSASQRVAERLRELIASGNLTPGDKLPSENELVRALQVSRPVVREALRGLSMMGIVESRQGGGCFVTDLKPSRLMEPFSFYLSLESSNLEEIFRARQVIDTALAEEAARRADQAQIRRLGHMAEQGPALASDPIGFRVMDAEFHDLIAEAARNAFLRRMSQSLYELAIELRRRASETAGVLEQSARDHQAIAAAIAATDGPAAAAAMAAHVEHIRQTTLAAARGD
jgi:GntR family transcriptional regulator, transcriptional repressor for pyruvate dehydrogenase complex